MAQFLASLSPQRRPREWEVYTSDAKDQVLSHSPGSVVQSSGCLLLLLCLCRDLSSGDLCSQSPQVHWPLATRHWPLGTASSHLLPAPCQVSWLLCPPSQGTQSTTPPRLCIQQVNPNMLVLPPMPLFLIVLLPRPLLHLPPSYGLAGCDGGRSHRYLQWLQGGGLDTSRAWPYVDGFTRCQPCQPSAPASLQPLPGQVRGGDKQEPEGGIHHQTRRLWTVRRTEDGSWPF